jgi:hypothetical protein
MSLELLHNARFVVLALLAVAALLFVLAARSEE